MKRNSYLESKNNSFVKRKGLLYLFRHFKKTKSSFVLLNNLYREMSLSESKYRLFDVVNLFIENGIVKKVSSSERRHPRKYEGFNLEITVEFVEVINQLNSEQDMQLIIDLCVGKERKIREWLFCDPIFDKKIVGMTIGYLGQDILIYFLESGAPLRAKTITEALGSSGKEVKKWLENLKNLEILRYENKYYSLNEESPFVKFLFFFWVIDCICISLNKQEGPPFTFFFLSNDKINHEEFVSFFSVFSFILVLFASKCK